MITAIYCSLEAALSNNLNYGKSRAAGLVPDRTGPATNQRVWNNPITNRDELGDPPRAPGVIKGNFPSAYHRFRRKPVDHFDMSYYPEEKDL